MVQLNRKPNFDITTFLKVKLKKALRELKSKEITDIKEIKYISKLPRRKVKTNNKISDCCNHDVEINNKFQNYCKETCESKEIILPDFDESRCPKLKKKK